MFVALGYATGSFVHKIVRDRAAQRDYFYYQYMVSHPDDFPLIGMMCDIYYLFINFLVSAISATIYLIVNQSIVTSIIPPEYSG